MARLSRSGANRNMPKRRRTSGKITNKIKSEKVQWIMWLNLTLILGLYAIEFKSYLGF